MNGLRLLRAALVAATALFYHSHINAQTIPQHFFGQNAWMPDTIGNKFLNGKLHQNWGKVAESGARLVRFGGITSDRDKPTNYQYLKMIDSVRARGMEPIIQVSYHMGTHTAQQAAQLVQYLNGTMNRNIKYWSIGNEPDLEYGYTSAAQVAAYIKPFASAMKAADPTIRILGPETAWYNESIINGLTTPGGPNDITGKDAAGRYYIDYISFHTYPFDGTQSRQELVSKLTESPGYETRLTALAARVALCNSAHNRTGSYALKTAVTELNVNYKNNSTDNVSGTGANSFIGAQFVAEMFGIGMKRGVDLMTIWSVIEGSSTALNIGYLDRTTAARKPLFHHYKMMADHFSGNYISSTSTHTNVKIFASQNSSVTTVLIMNQDENATYDMALRLNNAVITATNSLKVGVNAGIAQMYYHTIPNQSSVLLQFNQQGTIVKKVTYTIGHALAGQPPAVSVYQVQAPAMPQNITHASLLRICSGKNTTLTATSGTNTVKWYNSATSNVVLATGTVFTTPSFTAGAVSTVTYYSQASNNFTVSARTPVTVTIQPAPQITVNSGSVCQGGTFTLNPSGAATYTFSSGSPFVTVSANSSYTVTGTSANGCISAPAVAQVTTIKRPVISVNSGSVCAGNVFTMTPGGAVSYTYSNGSPTVSPVSAASYSVMGTNQAGCVSATPAISVVSVDQPPVISVNSGSICAGNTFTMVPSGALTYTFSSGSATVKPLSSTVYTVRGKGSNGCTSAPVTASVAVMTASISVNSGSVCEGEPFTLVPSGASSYTFSSGSAIVYPTMTTSYTVSGKDAMGCFATSHAVAHVTVMPKPAIAATSGSICAGNAFTIVPSGGTSYTINGGQFVVTPMANTVYTIAGSNAFGCKATALSVVNVSASPIVSVAGGTVCIGKSFTLSPSGAQSYSFSSGSAVVSPGSNTTYSVWGESNGCLSEPATAFIVVLTGEACGNGADTLTTGAGEAPAADVMAVFPNPNNGAFSIRVSDDAVYTITALSGEAVKRGTLYAGENRVDISGAQSGLYIVKVIQGDRARVVKIIKR